VWGLALLGILWKVWFVDRFVVVSTSVYLLMGWLAVIAAQPLLAALPVGGIAWILAGGLCYTAGVVFFGWKKLPYAHAVWHVLVVAGSVCHFLAVLLYVIPRSN
jgi:hemolysin III